MSDLMFQGWGVYVLDGIEEGILVLRNARNGSLAAFKDGEFVVSVPGIGRPDDDLRDLLPLALTKRR